MRSGGCLVEQILVTSREHFDRFGSFMHGDFKWPMTGITTLRVIQENAAKPFIEHRMDVRHDCRSAIGAEPSKAAGFVEQYNQGISRLRLDAPSICKKSMMSCVLAVLEALAATGNDYG